MEMVGYIVGMFLIGYLIVRFGIAKKYYKKHNQKMGPVRFIIWTIVMGLICLCFALLGGA